MAVRNSSSDIQRTAVSNRAANLVFALVSILSSLQLQASADEVLQHFEEFVNGDDEARELARTALLGKRAEYPRIANLALATAERRSELADCRLAAFSLWQQTQPHTLDSLGVCEQLLRRRSEPLLIRLAASASVVPISQSIKEQDAGERALLQLLTDDTEAPEIRCQAVAHLLLLERCSPAIQKAVARLCRNGDEIAEVHLALIEFLKGTSTRRPDLSEFCLLSLLNIFESPSSATVRLMAAAAVINVAAVAKATPNFNKIAGRWRQYGKDASIGKSLQDSALTAAELIEQRAKVKGNLSK